MHFIQNSWFLHHWTFIVLLFSLGFSLIAYINQKRKLFKQMAIVTCVFVAINLFSFINSFSFVSPTLRNTMLHVTSQDEVDVHHQSISENFLNLLFSIAKEKVTK
jgi:hypothetical protein